MNGSDRPDEVAYAGWGRRAVALLIDDTLILSSVFALYVLAWALGGYDFDTDTLADAWVAVYIPLFLLGPPLYFWLMIGRYGRTLGKRAMGITVRQSEDHSQVKSYARALGRVAAWLLFWLFVIPLLLSLLWPLWDARNQTLVDKLCRRS